MKEHVPAHAQMEEEKMEEPMNTLVVSASQPIGKYHCNDLGNNYAPHQRPPRPTIQCTKSMVWESMTTKSTKREGTPISTLNDNELDVPILEFMKKKKQNKCSCIHLRFVFVLVGALAYFL